MGKGNNQQDFLTGKFLVAMPGMDDPRFEDTILYICGHDASGAMGLIVNKLVESISFKGLMEQLEIEVANKIPHIPVYFGGPIEMGRGFVLHSNDYIHDSSVSITDDVILTATVDILKDMAMQRGPKYSILALGYSGWSPGQLENEIKRNGWLEINGDVDILFKTEIEVKRSKALTKLGIDPSMLSSLSGHA
ncbi:MAG: YqgE/AlgH family protein [Alphaproteobacteria bacterium]|nr:YqgE/AlgH family protein [Alphaproteobacteria bacterium]